MQKGKPRKFKREKSEFDQQIVDLARVTRVTSGGKHLSFRALVVIGDRKGRVGYGIDKGKDVQIAVEKAANQARKNIITVPMVNFSLPHRVETKFKAAKVMLKPAPVGSGIIAGSVVRVVLDLAGVPNVSAKILGRTSNKISNVKAVFQALQMFRMDKINNFSKNKKVVVADNTAIEVPELKISEDVIEKVVSPKVKKAIEIKEKSKKAVKQNS